MHVDLPASYQPDRVGDIKHSMADIGCARNAIGYEPSVYFREGLERTIDWYRENL